MSTTSESRIRWTLLAACVAHAAAFAVSARLAVRAAHEPSAAVSATEMNIEVEPLPAPAEATAGESASPSPPSAAAIETPHDRIAAASSRRSHGSSEGAMALPTPEAMPPSGDGTWSFSPTVTPPGAGGAGPGLSNHAFDTATHAGVNEAVAESLRREAERPKPSNVYTPSDMALGLVPGGVLVSLSRDRVRRSLVPDESRALVEFHTDEAGVISSIRVVEASSGRAEWNDVAAEIAADARARPLKVPAGARGLVVTLEVTSAIKNADGTSPNRSSLKKVWGAINDPMGAATNVPPTRVVASRIVNVQAL